MLKGIRSPTYLSIKYLMCNAWIRLHDGHYVRLHRHGDVVCFHQRVTAWLCDTEGHTSRDRDVLTVKHQGLGLPLSSSLAPRSQATFQLSLPLFLSSSPHTKKNTSLHLVSHVFCFFVFFRQCPIFHFHRKQNKRSCTVEVQLSPWESAARRLCFFMSEFNDLCARCNVIGHGQNVSCRLPQKRKKKKKNRCPNAANQLLADNLQPLQSHHSY